MTREEAQEIAINYWDNDVQKNGERVVLVAAKPPKNSWTNKEMLDSAKNDVCLENHTYNPIDAVLKYEEYREKIFFSKKNKREAREDER
jgi:hypothetical protein